MSSKLRIGLSGVALPGAKKSFPTEWHDKSRLSYYSSLFNTVEINSTFYKLPMPTTFEKWASEVPDDFLFTIKLWREITHAKELEYDLDNLDRFMKAANRIGNKKGCLLIQFPASIRFKYIAKVEAILKRLQKLDPSNEWQKVLEFRHIDWYNQETYSLLDKYDASIVLHDMPKSKNKTLNKKTNIVYLRFHGVKGDYKGSYSDDFLQDQAVQIKQWLKQGKSVYVYFNNTMGDAFKNAHTMASYIS